jgi:hypothetical protein
MDNESKVALVPVSPYLNLPRFAVPAFLEGMNELTKEANEKQPPRLGEFTQRAAAIHEASHCVIARLEGKKLKSAAIWRKDGNWLGEYLLAETQSFTGKGRRINFLLISALRLQAGEANCCSNRIFACGPGLKSWPTHSY